MRGGQPVHECAKLAPCATFSSTSGGWAAPGLTDAAEMRRSKKAQTTATNATASAAARRSTPQIKYSSKMGCKSAAGWAARRNCARCAALAVNSSPIREKMIARIRENGASRWPSGVGIDAHRGDKHQRSRRDAYNGVHREARSESRITTEAGPGFGAERLPDGRRDRRAVERSAGQPPAQDGRPGEQRQRARAGHGQVLLEQALPTAGQTIEPSERISALATKIATSSRCSSSPYDRDRSDEVLA
jgi:hypothetical protein